MSDRPDRVPTIFKEVNALPRHQQPNRRERLELVHQVFPSVVSLSWFKAMLTDPEHVLGGILRDIHRHETRTPGDTGRMSVPDLTAAMARHRQLAGDDYSMLPFDQAFQALAGWQPGQRGRRGGRLSIPGVARKVGLSKSETHRLLTGEDPTADQMAAVAIAYSKHPSYFLEYRKTVLLEAMNVCFDQAPESTVDFYRSLARTQGQPVMAMG